MKKKYLDESVQNSYRIHSLYKGNQEVSVFLVTLIALLPRPVQCITNKPIRQRIPGQPLYIF